MIKLSIQKRLACLTAAAFIFVAVSGCFSEAMAQRDPFKKPGWAIPRKPSTGTASGGNTVAKPVKAPVSYLPPSIEARIQHYMKLRATAVENGEEPPKVTGYLTLSELAVSGIFKTPRGYAAIVEAIPIKLSYSIYPGEKFFDGQLVAVEENRLVFRKVTKVDEGKFVASIENKPLQQYSTKAQIEGTAPVQTSEKPVETASVKTDQAGPDAAAKPSSKPFLSPLDEMNRLPAPSEAKSEDPKKSTKKPVNTARNKGRQ